jgi:anaerobic carbon-monoxide dehydrogenase iron sulfur subunit
MTMKILISDPNKCNGCRMCQTACAILKAGVCNPEKSRIRVIEMDECDRYLPLVCQNCEDAPCIAVCPKEAISRSYDQVMRTVIDYNKCVGCKMCLNACSFGTIGFDEDRGRPFKCDLCGGDPLCVHFCEPEALTLKDPTMIQYDQARVFALKRTAGMRR